MRTLALLALMVLGYYANAQTSNLIIFSEDGDTFTLFANGARQNSAPQTRVKASDLTGDGVKIKVVFQDLSMPEFSKYVILDAGQEVTFGIRRNKKGSYVLRLVSTAEKTNEPAVETLSTNKGNQQVNPNSSNNASQTTTVTTTSSTATQPGGNSSAEKVSMNVSMSGNENTGNLNMSVNANDNSEKSKPNSNGNNQEESVSMNVSVNGNDSNASMNVSMNASQSKGSGSSKSNNGNHYGQPKNGNNGNRYGQYKNKTGFCNGKGLSGQDMVKIKYDIQQKHLDGSRADMIKKVVTENCITSNQASEMIKLVSFDQSKYDLGMYAFQHIYDPSEYYLVVNLIGDISLRQKLEDYVLDYLKSSDSSVSGTSSTSGTNTSTNSQSSSNSSAPANGNIVININNSPVNTNTVNTTSSTGTSTTTTSNSEAGCALSGSQYDDIVKSIDSKPYSDTKMSVAKQALKSKCMTVSQVMGFARLFVHEDDKLEFAKFAYKYTSNKSDYYKVADVFSNSFTIDELNEFIDSQ